VKVLITGSSGFVGGAVAQYFYDKGIEVHLLLRKESVISETLAGCAGVHSHHIKIEYDEIHGLIESIKPDCVIHLASLFLSQHNENDLDGLVDSNIRFGLYMLEAMSDLGINNFINTGTSWQHYNDSLYEPVNLYAATKQAFQDVLDYYVSACSLDAVTLKLFDTYGSGDKRKKLVHLLMGLEKSGDVLEMSPGDQEINIVHVSDVCDAFFKSFEQLMGDDCQGHNVYAVSSKVILSLRNFVSEFEKARGCEVNIVWGGRSYRDREVMSVWKSYDLVPGWEQKVDLIDGLKSL